ncbi:Acetyltransferase (GNAT) domain-containing protein [Palleronia marisminoris]|uniref:Acetyltransferase Pat n=1 Tax=Palleronia marisminoris TaxID=315423 RepID=A0A1Y5SUY7_9RHOB|nr:GNAT family N-acetyltransferase [Palleronia marisminoris]SFG99683.1 Acetyltransferase (GNAT) domain-containing protein [Palleronia marisminoris]SLN48664.1 Acetyltransferase Pat [Palleronia marisminoris]
MGREVRTTLRDGRTALLRDLVPGDADALVAGFARLSPQSRVFRFLRAIERLEARDIETFTHPDHTNHEAIGALVEDSETLVPAGIGHFFRAPTALDRAELALTVIDPYQQKGLGSLILGRLLQRAATVGIRRLDAVVHVRNEGMARMLRQLGASSFLDGTTRYFDLPVHPDPATYPDTHAGDAVRRAWALEPEPVVA